MKSRWAKLVWIIPTDCCPLHGGAGRHATEGLPPFEPRSSSHLPQSNALAGYAPSNRLTCPGRERSRNEAEGVIDLGEPGAGGVSHEQGLRFAGPTNVCHRVRQETGEPGDRGASGLKGGWGWRPADWSESRRAVVSPSLVRRSHWIDRLSRFTLREYVDAPFASREAAKTGCHHRPEARS